MEDHLRRQLIELIEQDKSIPPNYKDLLFPSEERPQEYELVYGCKEREEDILADTMSVPFQAIKQFGEVKSGELYNKLIFGDNLQALKFMMKDPEIKGKVKLIYIDPPFATEQEFRTRYGESAYSDVVAGAKFFEFLRKRLIFLRKLLAPDGAIFVHCDWHFGHYIKVLLDEVFIKNNFRNEISVKRTAKHTAMQFEKVKSLQVASDSIFVYARSDSTVFNKPYKEASERQKAGSWHGFSDNCYRPTMRYELFGMLPPSPKGRWLWEKSRAEEAVKNYKLFEKTFSEKKIGSFEDFARDNPDMEFVRYNDGSPQYWILAKEQIMSDTSWMGIQAYAHLFDFPTEKSEILLERIINMGSNVGDLVLDCFAGSGTTGAVAEKLGRKWIMVDSSKLAIYTIIKRMFNLKKKIGNRGNSLNPKPFVLYNAGLYEDHDFILNLGEEQYKKFAMELFQVESKQFEINGLDMDGVIFDCPVKVFSQKGYLTEEYVDELHEVVGEQLKERMFIIAPASRVYFLQDYIEKNGIRYYILRIPYSVIDELHKQRFTRPIQPASSQEINLFTDAVGFDFIHPPEVECEYFKRKLRDSLIEEELVIKLKKFEAVQRSKEPIKFEDPRDALSMVLVDRNYNGKYFNLTDYFFQDQIKKEDWKVIIPSLKTGKKIMIIYLDVLGNERVEVKSINDFEEVPYDEH